MALKDKLEQIKKDKEQFQAYMSNNNTVVLAGPGSGKTTVLTMKIMKLLRDEIVSPRGLACVTFSREAAREFKDRLFEFGYTSRQNVFLGTMHSFCIAEVIETFAPIFPKYNIPLPINIISESAKKKLFLKVLDDLDQDPEYIKVTHMDKERRLDIPGSSQVQIEVFDIARQVGREYENRLHGQGFIDYEDIVKYATVLIQNEGYVRRCIEARFPWILIDEYQDLGRPLHEIILTLAANTKIKFFSVGDPDQSIFGFHGAYPEYLVELTEQPGFSKVTLKTNYRSNQEIIYASELALREKRNYIAGTRPGEMAEFDFITCQNEMDDQYQSLLDYVLPKYKDRGIPLEEIAIIVGTNDDVSELTRQLETHGMSVYVSKHPFERSDVVRWLESCARWVLNQAEIYFVDLARFWCILVQRHITNQYYDETDRCEKIRLYRILNESRVFTHSSYHWLQYVISQLEIEELLNSSTRYPDEIENLRNLVSTSQEPAFAQFDLAKLTHLGKPKNQLTVSTRHSIKGLEFEAVIILGLEDERFPSFRATKNDKVMQEERRLFFVCVSRAKSTCCLVHSKVVTINTKRGPWTKPFRKSRFIEEIYKEFGNPDNTIEF
ncbi:ATP-dependent helicase [Anaerospora sp.]|uniref:ATP-dependent helicase n=1 Tax=Anaerospora sp. TaxID=1960278 RepID=UPI00289BB352|nr:ATP-dependent helicase [Anaerospora sp.]